MAFQRKLWGECARLGAHYALLFALFPASVLIPAVFLSGLLTATIVTVSHVTDDLYFDGPHKVLMRACEGVKRKIREQGFVGSVLFDNRVTAIF